MNAKSRTTAQSWVDPDDAPELTDDFFESSTWRSGDKVITKAEGEALMIKAIRRGRPKAETPKMPLTIRYDADVVEAFRATGKGWQTRMNAALRDWLKSHSPA